MQVTKENIRLMGFCHLKRLLCVKAAQEIGIHSVSRGGKEDFKGKKHKYKVYKLKVIFFKWENIVLQNTGVVYSVGIT